MASSSGAMKTETASSGNVSAVLSYIERRGSYSNLRIRITRAGMSARDDPVPCGPTSSFQCSGAGDYLLGRPGQGWHRPRHARRGGFLNRGFPPRGARYLAKLRRFLRRTGYVQASRAAPRAAPTCSKSAARKAILSSSFGAAIKRKLHRWVKVGADPILGYGIWKLLCADVTRDGRKEMIAVLTCCTSDTPTPWAIFGQKRSGWRPIFQVVSRKLSLWGLRVSAVGDVIEKLPRFKPGDALCCPSAFSYRVTHWNGTRFVVRRAASAAAARSERCGRIDIEYPYGRGGSSAIEIRAARIDCSKARVIVASCMEGVVRRGWRARWVNDHSVYHDHILLTSGHRRITFHIAGGGGCGAL
jgi:hypothetical protein